MAWKAYHGFHNIKISSWTVNKYIRMISEGSCDTEDWSSNDAENSAFMTE